jgi:hypothetical protein
MSDKHCKFRTVLKHFGDITKNATTQSLYRNTYILFDSGNKIHCPLLGNQNAALTQAPVHCRPPFLRIEESCRVG